MAAASSTIMARGIESLTSQRVGLGILDDAVSLAQRIELSGKLGTVGGGELGQFEAGARLCLGGRRRSR